MKDTLGDRMKSMESTSQNTILPRCPAILRLDGRAFHTFTKQFEKPFDEKLHECFVSTTKKLMQDIGGTARLGYTQSDEVSILLYDCNRYESAHWFGRNVQKICSIGASVFTGFFNNFLDFEDSFAAFDARVFSIPEEDVPNYFIWRLKDCRRNSINAYAQSKVSHKELQGKSVNDLQLQFPEWHDLPSWCREGQFIDSDGGLTNSPYSLSSVGIANWFKMNVFFREE